MAETERTVEATGPDVEAAIAAGLADLNADRDAVEIEVLDGGSGGIFGFGARQARVRLTVKTPTGVAVEVETVGPPTAEPKPAGRSEAEIARGVLVELLTLLGIEGASVDVQRAEPAPGEGEPPLMLDVRGQGTDALIGRRGKTLAALQHITRLIVGQEMAGRTNLVVDVGGFKVRRAQSLRRLAKRMAEQAMRTNRRVVLEPMPPHERRVVHLALRDHSRVTTQSIGEGERRKVTIIPQR
jgi:spoIIIJ-associated protein